ncbi:MAG: RNA polymerase sigma factor [Sedimentibacter saalensis]|uniref:sigma-70 family RNA polymerase sigma factor n=1 Tax=Sedimentibacter saalensis TaxID=130788 RepID=UPI002B1ECDF0|nr:RNA polymerase sigma factor [Sedimentibacter saalensis]MEA5093576.1 RNA polymerase sigma factor [Sedimentibacter saalensis]
MDIDINHIIQQSLKGDKNFQEILLKRLRPLIYKNIYKYWDVWDTEAEDMAQEGYILILMSLKTFDSKKNVHYLHYIKTKLEYFYKNQHRKSGFRTNVSSLQDALHEYKTASSLSSIERIADQEEKYDLMKSIQNLSSEEQKIIYLYYFYGQSMQSISMNLGIKYGKVRSLKRQALSKLSIQMCRR